ncbi:MAG TPA: DNA-3-methyladenine glycosylase 2 family protein, partial [Rubrivivax sp.]|nr:DNA-3-methyladenine glycosylase 2 family protein [Rubrivivax sp.]
MAGSPASASAAPVVAATAATAPPYWDDACRHLARRDRVMKKLIPRFGQARLNSRGDAFTTLARSIVGQQISVKAAQSVWDRFVATVGSPAAHLPPTAVQRLGTTTMREAGLSARKCEYLQDLARHFAERQAPEADWLAMDDEAVIGELVAIRG